MHRDIAVVLISAELAIETHVSIYSMDMTFNMGYFVSHKHWKNIINLSDIPKSSILIILKFDRILPRPVVIVGPNF